VFSLATGGAPIHNQAMKIVTGVPGVGLRSPGPQSTLRLSGVGAGATVVDRDFFVGFTTMEATLKTAGNRLIEMKLWRRSCGTPAEPWVC